MTFPVQQPTIGRQKCGKVTFSLGCMAPDKVKRRLSESKIDISVSTISCTRLDMESRGLDIHDTVRAYCANLSQA